MLWVMGFRVSCVNIGLEMVSFYVFIWKFLGFELEVSVVSFDERVWWLFLIYGFWFFDFFFVLLFWICVDICLYLFSDLLVCDLLLFFIIVVFMGVVVLKEYYFVLCVWLFVVYGCLIEFELGVRVLWEIDIVVGFEKLDVFVWRIFFGDG